MERMLVVVFDDESKAYKGSSELAALNSEGSISIHSKAVVRKNADGTITIKQAGDEFPIRAVGGTAIGALIGVLGGPIGLGIGMATGAVAGTISDLRRAGVNEEFLEDVTKELTSGKWAVVSDISEEWVTPVDTRMDALGGSVHRTSWHDIEREENARNVAAMKAEIALLKKEIARSSKENKVKLQAKIDKLEERLRAAQNQAKQRAEEHERETKAKVQALEKKAAKARGKAKATIKARITEIKRKLKRSKD
jgi:uncharacterized membrane protein